MEQVALQLPPTPLHKEGLIKYVILRSSDSPVFCPPPKQMSYSTISTPTRLIPASASIKRHTMGPRTSSILNSKSRFNRRSTMAFNPSSTPKKIIASIQSASAKCASRRMSMAPLKVDEPVVEMAEESFIGREIKTIDEFLDLTKIEFDIDSEISVERDIQLYKTKGLFCFC
jgi:hypothetical protein